MSGLSPAEQLKQSQISLPYKEPVWGGPCEKEYRFEVLKNGTIVDDIDLTTKSFFVFGRLPSCDITMEHPSLSRHHAVMQYCSKTNALHEIGWYLYDLDSTHGTLINKNKVKPRQYFRVRVGHVLKFGGSTRLYILQVCNKLFLGLFLYITDHLVFFSNIYGV
uniref:Putative solute carrier family protein n=1 Tax=uncultured eukaryote TaxID=100272 RepID=A8DR78_9EUKA|nr:putative solute carrier family protein [uncultured eukaryote]